MDTNNVLKFLKGRRFGSLVASAVALGTSYQIYQNSDTLYDAFLMPTVRMLPPETSHNFAVWACKYKLYPTPKFQDDPCLHTDFFGRLLSNPIGIAAGFDKNGKAIEGLHDMGFGFVEIGSVTPKAQEGNPVPRVFRLESDRAVINRYGFNNDGHAVVLERLLKVRNNTNFKGIVGINLGKNANTAHAYEDYVKGVETFGPYADYLVINVSSPNTKGLRDLQNKDRLEQLLTRILEARNKLEINSNVPILLKLSPDLEQEDLQDICAVIQKSSCKVDGLIVANTTTARNNLSNEIFASEAGGLSGEPLKKRTTLLIAKVYKLTNGEIPIIGVGGISSGEDAYEKIAAGATYLQLYTALVYGGPGTITKIKKDLAELLKINEYKSVKELVGTKHRHYYLEK